MAMQREIDLGIDASQLDLSGITADEKTACGRKPLLPFLNKKKADAWKKCVDDYTKSKNAPATTNVATTPTKPANAFDLPNLSDEQFANVAYTILSAKKLYDDGKAEIEILTKYNISPTDSDLFLTKLKDPDTYVEIKDEASKRKIDLDKLMNPAPITTPTTILGTDISKISNTELTDFAVLLSTFKSDVQKGLTTAQLGAKYGVDNVDNAIKIVNDAKNFKTIADELSKRKLNIKNELTKQVTTEKLQQLNQKYLAEHPVIAKVKQTNVLPISSIAVGAIGGAIFAFATKRSPLGYVASILIGSAIGAGAGFGIKAMMNKDDKKSNATGTSGSSTSKMCCGVPLDANGYCNGNWVNCKRPTA